jgi:hypothetical protein
VRRRRAAIRQSGRLGAISAFMNRPASADVKPGTAQLSTSTAISDSSN